MDELRRLFASPLKLAAFWWLLPICGILFAATINPIPPHDYWWALVMGREIASGSFPNSNLFLFTLPVEKPFLNQPWLGQWILFELSRWGHGVNVLARNVSLGLSLGLMMWSGLRVNPRVESVSILAIGVMVVAFPGLAVRTQSFALLPFVWTLVLALGVRDGRFQRKWLWTLVPAIWFWAQVHGTFVLAPVMLGVIWLDARERWTKEWVVVGAASALIGLLHPLGPEIFTYVKGLVFDSTVGTTVQEWSPPGLDDAQGIGFWLLCFAGLAVAAAQRKQLQLSDGFLLLFATWLGTGAVRNLVWWAFIWVVVLAKTLPRSIQESETKPFEHKLHWGLVSTCVLGLILAQPGLFHANFVQATSIEFAKKEGEGAMILEKRNSIELVRALKGKSARRVFHDQALGGLIEFELSTHGAQAVAFVDQRMELIDEHIWDDYFLASSGQDGWKEVFEKWKIDAAILHIEDQAPLIEALKDSGWRLRGESEAHQLYQPPIR